MVLVAPDVPLTLELSKNNCPPPLLTNPKPLLEKFTVAFSNVTPALVMATMPLTACSVAVPVMVRYSVRSLTMQLWFSPAMRSQSVNVSVLWAGA